MASQPNSVRRRPHRFAGMSKEARKNARREVFLEAGTDLIGSVGIAETKVRDVCARAELTERYFYESFPDLDSFARQVVQSVALKVAMQLLEKALPIGEGHARLRAVATELISTMDEDPRVGRILFVETARAGGELADLRQQMLYSATWLMTEWLSHPEDEIDLAAVVRPLLSRSEEDSIMPAPVVPGDIDNISLAGAASEVLLAWTNGRISMTADEMVEYILRFIDRTVAWQSEKAGGTENP